MAERLPVLLWHLGRRGGGPRYTLELARELAQRDDVELHLGLSRQSELFDETLALGVPALAIDTYSGVAGFVAGLARVPAIAGSIRSYVQQHRLPVALCTMAHLWNAMLVPALKKGGAANCLVVHDAMPHTGENYAVRHLLIRNDVRQADAVITVSDAVRRQILDRHQHPVPRVWTSHMGPFRYGTAREGRQTRRLGSPPHRLLFFGRLLPYKGLSELIAAMRLLEKRHVPVELLVVGNGAAELPSPPSNVRIDRRWVPEAEISNLFAEVDLVILPYRETSQSGVIPIAQYMGVPTVVTPLEGLVEQVAFGDGGFIAGGSSAEALADAIEGALSDPDAYARISARILDQDSDTLWARITDGIVDALRAVAASR